MKKRICFVDDDPKALKLLEDAMATVGDTWSCTFAATGNAAIKAMSAGPFDAIVTKMRMPGMSGAKLLQEVGKLHPKTLRFILGDLADRELIVNCVSGTHQFIAGPCNPQDLVAIVQRSLALDTWLSTDQLRALVPRLTRLPTLPSVYFEVLKQVESPNAGAKNVGEAIGRDPAVTARVLQMVNSAAFAVSQKVTDPVNAVSLLGIDTVKSLVLCLQVFTQNDQAKQAGLSFDRLWNHSLSVAKIARDITQLETHDARKASDAFTAGLLHDVGRIVMASNLPQEYAAITAAAREHKRCLHEEEAAQLGVTHAQVGAYLLGLWGMPSQFVEAAALHHTPSHTFTKEFSLLTAVHAADVFAHEKEADTDGLPLPPLDVAHLGSIGLADKPDAWRKTVTVTAPAAESSAVEKTNSTTAFVKSDAAAVKPGSPIAKTEASMFKAKHAAPPQAATGHRPNSLRSQLKQHNWLGWAVASGAAAIVFIALLLWLNRSDAKADISAQARKEPAKPTRTAATTPSNSPESNLPKPIQMSPFDSVKVQAIFYRTVNPAVVINGKMLEVGERVNGLQVVSIGHSEVVLAFGNERKTLRMK